MKCIYLCLFTALVFAISSTNGGVAKTKREATETINEEEARALAWIAELDEEINLKKNKGAISGWKYASNITDENEKENNKVSLELAKELKELAFKLKKLRYEEYIDADLSRKIKKLAKLDYAALPEEKYMELTETISDMQSNYAKVKVCDYKDRTKCDLALEPEITDILIKSRDPEELKYYWQQWYDKAGTAVRDKYKKYLELNKEAAKLNGFPSGAEAWLDEYDDSTFEEQLEKIFQQIRPFYEQLHAYVRYKLRVKYGDSVVPEKSSLPMHLLGNMWGQTWGEVSDLLVPYPDKKALDVTEEMVKQGYTERGLFEKADEFFQSLNMTKMPDLFWQNSILKKPDDGRELICHASAWDFYLKDDVRIKQCTRVTMDQFSTAHHEMGHIQYYLQYQHQPTMYREGANPGFHEAVGDVLALSVSTPKHLLKVGLLKDYVYDEEAKINQLMSVGLDKIAFLPFAYTIDKYRWSLFRGETSVDDNCKFWKMREEYGGVEPPVTRSNSDFDAPAKYHVSADVEYLRYLVSFIVQFQFHKAACEKAGEYVPGDAEKTLINCDIYGSAEAGNALKSMLSMGSSKPWPEAMEVLTGQRKMDAGPLLEYFQPLQDWLIKTNKANGVFVGWEKSEKCIGGGGFRAATLSEIIKNLN